MYGGNGEVWRIGLGVVLAIVTAWLPGLAVTSALAPRLGRLTSLAAAPAVGAALLYTTGQILTWVGWPVDERLTWIVLAGAALVLATRGWPALPRRVPAAVVLAWGIGALFWAVGARHLLAVPPHDDGYNHGFFVARVARFATLDPSIVIPHDVVSGGHAVDFYPLALHQQAAFLVSTLRLDVGAATAITMLTITVIGLPLGMYVIGRSLFPENPRIWSLCAVVAALLPGVTYSTSWWGGYAMIAGFAALPGVFVCVAAASSSKNLRLIAVAGLGLTGLAGIHTSMYTLAACLAGLVIVVPTVLRRQLRDAIRATVIVSCCFLWSLVLLIPVLGQLLGGVAERSYRRPEHGIPLARAVVEVVLHYSFVTPLTPGAVVLAFWVGAVVCVRQRRATAWIGAWFAFIVLYIWLAWRPEDLIVAVTSSWYSDRFRIGYILAFLSIPIIAAALAGPTAPVAKRRGRLLQAASFVLLLIFVGSTAIASMSGIRRNYDRYALIGPDQREAFRFLAERSRPGERVLNQAQDGSPWMYSLYGVAPVVALKTTGFEKPEWADAVYLMRHVGLAGHDTRTDALLTSFQVRYVYVNRRTFPEEKPSINVASLESSGRFRLAFSRGDARVYEILAP